MSNGFTFADEGKDFILAPEGTHIARCFRVVVLGTFDGEWQGRPKLNRKIRLDFELPGELNDFGNGPEPMFVSTTMNIAMGENANYRKFLQNWRGKAYTPDEAKKGVDVSKFLGHVGMLTIQHNESSQGRTFANLATIIPLPKGMDVPAPINKPVLFSVFAQPFDAATFEGLPESLQNKIKESREWKEMNEPMPTSYQTPPAAQEDDDDLPF